MANSLAMILAGRAVAAGVIGLLVAFGYINEDSTQPFEDGVIWMLGCLILGLCANVFRREHHVVDNTMDLAGTNTPAVDRYVEEPRVRMRSRAWTRRPRHLTGMISR